MLLMGIGLIGWGSFFYLNAGLGSGPRDGLMMALNRILGIEIWMARMAIEVSVLILGYLLGGPVGLGTAITAFASAPQCNWLIQLPNRSRAPSPTGPWPMTTGL